MKKILYIISHSELHEDRYWNLIKTWAKDVDHVFYSDHEDKTKHIIKTSNNKSYGSGEEKLTTMMNILPEQYLDYDWYMHCDNDTFVNTKKIFELAQSADPKKIHGLIARIEFPQGVPLNYCGGGAGYLMSNEIYHNFYRGKSKTYNSNYGDVAIGVIARENNIQFQHHEGFNSFPPSHYGMTDSSKIANQYTFHYIHNFDLMKHLYENSKNNSQFELESSVFGFLADSI